MDADYDPSRTVVVLNREGGDSPELVVLTSDGEGALTLLVRNWGYAVKVQIGEDVDEYHRLYTVAAADVPRMIDAWLRESGEAPPDDKDRLALSVGRLIIGELVPKDEGSTVIGRFIAWLRSHDIPYRSEEQPSPDDAWNRLTAALIQKH